MLCGKTFCPIIMKLKFYLKTVPLVSSVELFGASPPAVFVGRIGYPYVYIGPLIPPLSGDTSFMDAPELWMGKGIEEIVKIRFMLVRGKFKADVRKPEKSGKFFEKTLELALSQNSVETEAKFKHKPSKIFILDDEIQPFGLSATVKNLEVENAKWDHRIEDVYWDTDLKAAEAVVNLYLDGVSVSRIQRAFSVGAFGLKKQRRLVPTRWSITAVDSIISNYLMQKIKRFPELNEFRVYESYYLDNRFLVLFMPDSWSYEAMEAWWPGTIWNPTKGVALFSSWESYWGRTTYAEMGGCYYAARLAVCEKLVKEKRQAKVVVFREAGPGYIMPVGVWQVRENVRNAMKTIPKKFDTLKDALDHISSRLKIPLGWWIKNSNILKDSIKQKKLTEYIGRK